MSDEGRIVREGRRWEVLGAVCVDGVERVGVGVRAGPEAMLRYLRPSKGSMCKLSR